MSAALVAARARDPERITPEAPARVSFEEPAEARQGQADQIGEPSLANGSSSSSAIDTTRRRHSYDKSPFQTSSLPPEILGLFNRTGQHSRTPTLHQDEVSMVKQKDI